MATEQEPGPSVLVLPNGPVRPSEAAALRVSLNLLPEPAMVFAIDGTILQANASALSLLEGAENELIGESIYSLCSIGPEKNREVAAHLGRGATIRFEMDFRTLKGNSRRVDSINMPVVTVAGKVESVIGFVRDISERKRVENERAMMAAVVESSGDAIMTVALDGTITSWNRRAEELFGFTQAAAIGLPFLIMVPPEKRPLAMSMVEEIKANRERVINFEGPALRSDGGVIEILMTLFGIYNREGKLLGLSSIMRDITERKRAESAQRMLAAIVNASEDAIVSLALDNRIDSWNSGAEKLFGVAPENALGRNMLELVPPQEHARVGDALAELSRTGKPSSFRLHSSRKDGAAFDMWVNLFPIYDASGKLSAVGGIGRDVADLVKLRNEDAALATIVTASQDAIIGFSEELKITIWNPAAERLYGFTATEAIGRGFDLFVPPEELASALEADRSVLETGEPITFQQRAQKKDGAWFVSQVNIFPIRDAAGRIVAGAGIGRDITGLLKLESQQALLAAIVESSDDAIISLSPEFKIMTWNKGAQNLFGFTAAEAIGKTNLELYVPAEDRELVKGWMQDDFAAINRNPAFVRRFDWLGKKNDGSAADVGLVVSGIHDARGDLIGLSLMMRDITERNRAESEKAVFAAIVDASQDAIINVSPEAKIISWNPAAERAYGYRAEEAIGQSIELFVPAEELPETIARSRVVVETGQSASWEQHARNRDGTPFISAVSIFPVRNAAGEVTGIAGIGRDITRMKQVEKQLRENARELESAREAALAASQAKSEFLSSMSHEIRTPMNAILGMAQLLEDTPLNSEQRKYLEIMTNNGDSLLELINSILDLARIESGRLSLEQAGFDLESVVDSTVETLAVRAHQKGLEMLAHVMPGVPLQLVGDRLRLRQILFNLVGNAVKFTQNGQVLLTVDRDRDSLLPGHLHFSIADSGIGIPRDKLEDVFSNFTQADASTTRTYGGSGLGLAIVRRLVALMGGRVWVESELGRGSVFHFTARFEVQTDAPAERRPTVAVMLSGVRALVVDDNSSNRLILREMLSSRGAEVDEAENGPSALEHIERARVSGLPYKLMLLDCRMPEMDGFEVAERVKAGAEQGLTVMMLSSDDLKVQITHARKLGLDAYLVKPVRRIDLFEAIGTAMATHTAKLDAGATGAEQQNEAPVSMAGPVPQTQPDHPLSILLADDSKDNRLLIHAYLKGTGYLLDDAENGLIAVAKLKAGNYDVVLMDIQMPEMDGLQATRAIRAWEREHGLGRTPILALTASALDEDVRHTLEAGVDMHVTKPIKKAVLIAAIQQSTRVPYTVTIAKNPNGAAA